PGEAANISTSKEPLDRARQAREQSIEEAREEVELITAQLNVKRAQLQAAETGVLHAQQRLGRIQELSAKRAVDAGTVEQARQDLETQTSQVLIKRAELGEPEVRLRQAARRLAALEGKPEQLHWPRPGASPSGRKTPGEVKSEATPPSSGDKRR